MSEPQSPLSYWDYIKVEQLLELQGGVGGSDETLSNDEVRFIVIHQIDELWFKLVIRELAAVRDLFRQDYVPETSLADARAGLGRVALTFDLAAKHFQLMETMRTQDYLKFRDKLFPASGFQSAQMREIEILLGLGDEDRLAFGEESNYQNALRNRDGSPSPAYDRVARRLADTPSVKDAIYAWLWRTPINGSSPGSPDDDQVVHGFLEEFLGCHERYLAEVRDDRIAQQALTAADQKRLGERYAKELDATRRYLLAEDISDQEERTRVRRMRAAILFIESNRELPLLSWPGEIIDSLIAAEQGMLVFRQRHARMVERVIGRRVGTGGSAGVDYLDQTALSYRVFKEIWAARTLLLDPERAPQIQNKDFYGLRTTR